MTTTTKEARTDHYPSRKAETPSIIDRKDPVVYASGKEIPSPLTEDSVAEYERKGFVVIQDLFAESETEMFRRELARLAVDPKMLERPEAITEPESSVLRSLFAFHLIGAGLTHLATDPRLVRIAQYLLNDEIYIHQSRLNLKQGFRGQGFYWHSDFETWHVEDGMPRMRALSMSIALTDNTAYNGSLMLIPKSHKQYISCVGETPGDNYKKSLKNQYIGVPDNDSLSTLYSGGGIRVPVGPAGSVTIFDCNTMHGSANNISPLPRSNAFVVFNAMSNRVEDPFCAQPPRPEFIASRETIRQLG